MKIAASTALTSPSHPPDLPSSPASTSASAPPAEAQQARAVANALTAGAERLLRPLTEIGRTLAPTDLFALHRGMIALAHQDEAMRRGALAIELVAYRPLDPAAASIVAYADPIEAELWRHLRPFAAWLDPHALPDFIGRRARLLRAHGISEPAMLADLVGRARRHDRLLTLLDGATRGALPASLTGLLINYAMAPAMFDAQWHPAVIGAVIGLLLGAVDNGCGALLKDAIAPNYLTRRDQISAYAEFDPVLQAPPSPSRVEAASALAMAIVLPSLARHLARWACVMPTAVIGGPRAVRHLRTAFDGAGGIATGADVHRRLHAREIRDQTASPAYFFLQQDERLGRQIAWLRSPRYSIAASLLRERLYPGAAETLRTVLRTLVTHGLPAMATLGAGIGGTIWVNSAVQRQMRAYFMHGDGNDTSGTGISLQGQLAVHAAEEGVQLAGLVTMLCALGGAIVYASDTATRLLSGRGRDPAPPPP